MGADWGTDPHASLKLSSRKARDRLCGTFALVRAKMPAKLVLIGDGPDRGAAEYLVRKKKLQKDVFFLGKQNAVYQKLSAPISSCYRHSLSPSASPRWKPWPAKSR